jgi:hypothetical protein
MIECYNVEFAPKKLIIVILHGFQRFDNHHFTFFQGMIINFFDPKKVWGLFFAQNRGREG